MNIIQNALKKKAIVVARSLDIGKEEQGWHCAHCREHVLRKKDWKDGAVLHFAETLFFCREGCVHFKGA